MRAAGGIRYWINLAGVELFSLQEGDEK